MLLEYLTVYAIGALGYGLMELLYRGFTHWTMLLAGGFCFTGLYLIVNAGRFPLWAQCVLGALLITAVELLTGLLVNVALKWNVWDYSSAPLQLLGQICLPFSLLWLALCLPASYLCRGLHRLFTFT